MKITNTLDHARDIAIEGGFVPVESGATVDLNEHLPAGDAQKLGRSLNEQDGWTSSEAKRAKTAAKKRASKTEEPPAEPAPVADEPPADNEENT